MGEKRSEARQKDSLKSGKKSADGQKQKKQNSQNLSKDPGRGINSLSDIPLTPENILSLQRTVGNRAATRLVQAKLKIGEPQDQYEREADQAAEQVLRMPEEELQRQTVEDEKRKRPEEDMVQTKPASTVSRIQRQAMTEEERKKRPEEETAVQAKEEAGETPSETDDVESQIESIRGGGDMLPGNVRTYFETRFGQDFSGVRVHKGAQAAETAQAINAKAYTTGKDIVFGAGEYAPETMEGKKILAHELTHVMQQGSVSKRVQRYEAGEHAQFGETQAECRRGSLPQAMLCRRARDSVP